MMVNQASTITSQSKSLANEMASFHETGGGTPLVVFVSLVKDLDWIQTLPLLDYFDAEDNINCSTTSVFDSVLSRTIPKLKEVSRKCDLNIKLKTDAIIGESDSQIIGNDLQTSENDLQVVEIADIHLETVDVDSKLKYGLEESEHFSKCVEYHQEPKSNFRLKDVICKSDRPGKFYDEHQAAMVQLRQDYKDDIDDVKKEHQAELEKCRQEYLSRIQDCSQKIQALKQEVEKYRVLAGIEELTQAALSDADAAQKEAGLGDRRSVHLTNGFTSPEGERMIVVTGTPQQQPQYSAAATPECLGKEHPVQYVTDGSPADLEPLHPPSELVPSPQGVGLDEDTPPRPPLPHGMSAAPGGPPAPPPPPGMAVRKGPLKPVISPRSPMKPLFWQRLQVHDLKKKEKSNHLFWEDIEEAKVDLDEFDDLFSKVPIEPKKKKDSKPKSKAKKEVAKVLDPKRSQALGIFLSSLRVEISDVENAILNFDTSVVDEEKLKTIFDMKPEDDELKKIKKQLDKHPDVPLDKPEHFLYELSQIPNYADRIFCFNFQTSFQESMSGIEAKLNNLKMTCEVIISGTGIKHIFGLILAMGNYMNGGSRTRGQADGFGLEILPKLRDVKGKDSRTSLLQYLVVQYVRKFEGEKAGTERVSLPIPDPSDINQAAQVNFDDLQKEIKRIKKDFDSAQNRFEKVLKSDSSTQHQQPFKDIMTEFFSRGNQDFKEQQENLTECQKKFQDVVVMFCMKPKGGESSVSPDHFFSYWLAFCTEFKDLWKKEQQKVVKQRIKDAQNKVESLKKTKASSIVKKPMKAGGLKHRLAQKGYLE